MKQDKNSKVKIAKSFATSTKLKDFDVLNNLLFEGGEFEIQPETTYGTEIVNKSSFLNWYAIKLETTSISDIDYDQCMSCEIGKPVILFNKGKFPRTPKESHNRSKTGLMLKIQDDKIIEIKFCYVFLKTENKYVFECQGDEIKKLIKKGVPPEEAIARVTGLME